MKDKETIWYVDECLSYVAGSSRSINTGAEGWKKETRPAHASASECWDMPKGYCKEELAESNKTQKISKNIEPL